MHREIRAIEGFATAAECAWLIELARGSLRRAQIYRKDAAGFTEAGTRTNSEADYTLRQRRPRAQAGHRADRPRRRRLDASCSRWPSCCITSQGSTSLLTATSRNPATPALAREVERRGQRVATVLVYLNDDYDGGETEFPRIGLRHRAATGDALLFANVQPSGALDYDTLHAGLRADARASNGCLSQWIRDRPVDGSA